MLLRRTTHHAQRRRGRLVATVLAIAVAVLAAAASATTAQAAPGDHFTCRASTLQLSALSLSLLESTVANAPNDPCANDSRSLVNANLSPLLATLGARAVNADTSVSATGATARASSADAGLDVLLPLPLLSLLGVGTTEATASYACVDGVPTPTGHSRVTGLRVLGIPGVLDTDQPMRLVALNLLSIPVANIWVNQQEVTAGRIIQRAVVVEVLGSDGIRAVIGEASAGVTGNPCPPVTPPVEPPVEPPVDPGLHAPVIDDAPPASTPVPDATFLYHAVDRGVTLECRLDGGSWVVCNGRSTFRELGVGRHCFDVRARRGERVGPTATHCWTITALPAGCTAVNRQGWFIKAGNTALGRRQAVFHATTHGAAGRIVLSTRSAPRVLKRVAYRLDGRLLKRGARAVLTYAQLDRAKPHTLVVRVRGNGRGGKVTRTFRYVSYAAVSCDGRVVEGAIAPKRARVAGGTITVKALVPNEVKGTSKLRFMVTPSKRHLLRAAHFSLDGRTIRQHNRSVAFTGSQLKADGKQTLKVRLVPKRGAPVTVTLPFRTSATNAS